VPNLDQIKFKLSEEEEQTVGDNSNVIAIGRSGTGKTTCALMRLFAIEFLYKNKESKRLTKDQKGNQVKNSYLNEIFGLRSIFLTASPVLILEIRQKYEELVQHVAA
jgi:ABC-type lipoprotein export system ATPase subunit